MERKDKILKESNRWYRFRFKNIECVVGTQLFVGEIIYKFFRGGFDGNNHLTKTKLTSNFAVLRSTVC